MRMEFLIHFNVKTSRLREVYETVIIIKFSRTLKNRANKK